MMPSCCPQGRTYLYGVVKRTREVSPSLAEIDGSGPVHVVACDGLGCVVSQCLGEPAAQSREELVRQLLAHQQVIERVMQHSTVLPVKFGTYLPGPDEVREMLAQCYARLEDALDRIAGCVEMEVAATWDLGRVLSEVSLEEEVTFTRAEISRKGQPAVEDRVRLGQVVKRCLDQRRREYQLKVLDLLRDVARGVAVNELVSDAMVMNVAFLIEESRREYFNGLVAGADSQLQGQVNFRIIGPLPPYSFSTVEVSRLTPEQVAEALNLLGLKAICSREEVRKSYRRMAAAELVGGCAQGSPGLERLRTAERVLLQVCETQGNVNIKALLERLSTGAYPVFALSFSGPRSAEVDASRFGAAAVTG